ncbi:unnamed protein product [Macrosiphum euphorbiae]|uniref:Uncharacterized protein n=1 Tax=Macrosiphum euphorbiae TaxID=13131 RepID=A0AAV0XHY7_9HEMI|nr:unnamed protein product [Macrosiphum euphorbiae]
MWTNHYGQSPKSMIGLLGEIRYQGLSYNRSSLYPMADDSNSNHRHATESLVPLEHNLRSAMSGHTMRYHQCAVIPDRSCSTTPCVLAGCGRIK